MEQKPSKTRAKLSKTWVVLAALPGAALPACTQARQGPVPAVTPRQPCKGLRSGTGGGADAQAPAQVPAPSRAPSRAPSPVPAPVPGPGTHRSPRPLRPCHSARAIYIDTPPNQHSPAPAEGLAGSLARWSAGKAVRGERGDGGAGVWGRQQRWGTAGTGHALGAGAEQSSSGVL